MTPQQPPNLVTNPYNRLLAQKHSLLQRAVRYALGTVCDPTTGLPLKGVNLRKQLKLIQINALSAGDNIIIPASAGVKQIFEMVMWNVAAQTIIWQQGLTSGGTPIVQTKFTGFPALTGFVLGFNGSFEMPHWEIDNLQPLVLNLSVGTEVDGFIRYRVANGTT